MTSGLRADEAHPQDLAEVYPRTHSVTRIQLLFEWFEGFRGTEELPFDSFCMVVGPKSDLAFEPAWTCQDTVTWSTYSGLHKRRRA